MARELGIDLSQVRGCEHGGRIVLDDVRNYIATLQRTMSAEKQTPTSPAPSPAAPAAPPVDFAQWGPVTRRPLSPLRRTIGRRMLESWITIPHVTQFDEADISRILAMRERRRASGESSETNPTVTVFVLHALASTLKKHPLFNASIDEAAKEIVFKDYIHIGIAVNTEAGLLVPVLRDADRKTLPELSRALAELTAKTRERKVTLAELSGGTFTVSNQGGIGGAHFTPIINKPEVAILGIGRAVLKPVVKAGKIEPATMLPLALSYDHRLIDGAEAARFVRDLIAALENFEEAGLNVGPE